MNNTKWNEYRQKHVQHLQEHGVEDALDYIEQFSSINLENRDEQWDETREALNEMASEGSKRLRGFCRVYPRNNQDVMFINSNPKLTIDEDFRKKDNYLLSLTDRQRFREAISIAGGLEWLDGNQYFWDWMNVLEAFPDVAAPWSQRDEFESPQEWILEDRFQNVYYTNWYKFASEDEGYYEGDNDGVPNDWNYDEELAAKMLDEEIKAVNPDVIVSFGGNIWNGMFKGDVEPLSLGDGYSTNGERSALYKVHGFPMQSSEYSARVLPLYHPSGWGRVPSQFPNDGRNKHEEDQKRRELAIKYAEEF